MKPNGPMPPAKDREQAKVDTLLEVCQPLTALSPVVHTRIKRRLGKSLAGWNGRRARWLKPAVVTSTLLLCGVASGLALDRMVLKPSPPAIDVNAGASAPVGRRPRPSKAGLHQSPTQEARPESGENAAESVEVPPAPAAPAPLEDKPQVMPLPAATRRLAMPSPAVSRAEPRSLARVEPPPTALSPGTRPLPSPTAILAPPPEPSATPALAPAKLAAPSPAPVASPALAPGSAVAPLPLPPAPPARPSPPSVADPSEARMLATAVRALRTQNDPRSALVALDEYGTRYPLGRLAVEAAALRAGALMALDRRDEALRVLDRLNLADVPGGCERQLQRAELRAVAGRPRDAIADFDAVLERMGHGDSAERALWGRAQSRLASGDRTGAQNDASLYLRRHPTGRFAGPARRLAGGQP